MNSPSVNPRYTFFELQVVAVHLCITLSFLQSPMRGHSVLTLQLHSRVSCVSFWTIFFLCPLIICDMFWVQLLLTLTVFLLKILCNLLELGKCFSIKFQNAFATLVDTSKLNGELLIIFVSFFLIFGWWFDDTSVYINLSFGSLYGRYVLFSKLNVTYKKTFS